MDKYYERYWKKDGSVNPQDNVTGTPPEWQEKDLRRIMSCLTGMSLGRVLDVGCGAGYFIHRISKLDSVKEIFGSDVSETAIKKARSDYPGGNFSVGDITSLSFEDNFFDTVLAIEVLEHIVDVGQALKELNRILKKGGYLIITTTDFNLLKRIIIALFFFGKYFYPTNPHIRFFDKKTLSSVLSKNGFSVIKHKWHGSYFGFMPKGQIMVCRKI